MIHYSSVKNVCPNPFESKKHWVLISTDLYEGKAFDMMGGKISSYLPLIWDRRDDKVFQLQKDLVPSVPEFY